MLSEPSEDVSDHLAVVRKEIPHSEDLGGLENLDFLALIALGLHLRKGVHVRPKNGEGVAALVFGMYDGEVVHRNKDANLLRQFANGGLLGGFVALTSSAWQLPEDGRGLSRVADKWDAPRRIEKNCDSISRQERLLWPEREISCHWYIIIHTVSCQYAQKSAPTSTAGRCEVRWHSITPTVAFELFYGFDGFFLAMC